jgi:integrase
MRTSRTVHSIDRQVPGVGRITIRAKRISKSVRNELDRYIVRAAQEAHLEQLRMLKDRQIDPFTFLHAARTNTLPQLRPSPALRPLVDVWLSVSGLRPNSVARYRQSWNFIFASLGSSPTLRDVTPVWWQKFVQGRGEISTSTLNRDRAAILAFLTWAKDTGHNPSQFETKRLKEEPNSSRVLTKEQLGQVRRNCKPEWWPFIWTLLETGARQGEILNLRSKDVSPDEPFLTIRSEAGSKSRGKARFAPISQDLAQVLREIGNEPGNGRLFPNTRHQVRHWWAKICEVCGIEEVSLHGVRATYITTALDHGVPIVDVQKLAGHSSVIMTMRYYRNSQQSNGAAETIRGLLGLGQGSEVTA